MTKVVDPVRGLFLQENEIQPLLKACSPVGLWTEGGVLGEVIQFGGKRMGQFHLSYDLMVG